MGEDLVQDSRRGQVQGEQLFSGQRVPVPQRAAQVLVHLVVVTALGEPHGRHHFVRIQPPAEPQQKQQPCVCVAKPFA